MRRSPTILLSLLFAASAAAALLDAPQDTASADRPLQQKAPEPAAPTEPTPPAADLEWRTLNFSGSRSPSFIPEKVLATRTLEELGLTGSEISGVSRLKRKAQSPACQWWRLPPADRGEYASCSIEEAIASERSPSSARSSASYPASATGASSSAGRCTSRSSTCCMATSRRLWGWWPS